MRGGLEKLVLCAVVASLSPLILRATPITACPSTIVADAGFPGVSYVCSEGDDLWLGFENLGAPLPDGTIFHIDSVASSTAAITLEPGGTDQFIAGDTYKWEYEIIEDSAANPEIILAGSAYDADLGDPTLTTTVDEVDVTYPDDVPTPAAPGPTLGTLDLTNGALQDMTLGGVEGLQVVDTLTIGSGEVVQSVSNEIGEAREPMSSLLLGSGLLLLGAFWRRRLTALK